MLTVLRGLAVLVLGFGTAIGVGYLVFGWPLLMRSESMLVWGWVGMLLGPIAGLITLPFAMKFWARTLGVTTWSDMQDRDERR